MASRTVTTAASRTTSRGAIFSLAGAMAATALDMALLAFALGGMAPLLRHPRALTLLAVWGVGALVLALVRPVRTHDPLEVHREAPLGIVALFLIPLLTPPVSAFGERFGVWPLPGGAALRWAGVVLAAVGLATRITAMARLGSRFSPLITVQKRHALETRGLYARVRHPGYLGSWLAALGAALAFGSALALPLVAAMLGALDWRMRSEEQVLERHFGEEFRRYRQRTGRFLPRVLPSRTS